RGSTFFFSSRRRHTRFSRDWSSDVCSSDLKIDTVVYPMAGHDSTYPTTLFANSRVVIALDNHTAVPERLISNPHQVFESVRPREIGRASCRERGCITEVAGARATALGERRS